MGERAALVGASRSMPKTQQTPHWSATSATTHSSFLAFTLGPTTLQTSLRHVGAEGTDQGRSER